ncbi:LDCC motif putative metal-binding protein [Youngiibacter fragilis]|nr:LDCC motif putative metal-binding protein [Youngiibacter fragilis]
MVILFLSEVIDVKKWFKEFIDRLGKSNEKTFGSGSLKCCDLNKDVKKK